LLAVNDLVEFAGTSEDLAIAMSILLTMGAADCVAVADGMGDGVGEAEGVEAGINFPESQARTVLPLLFVLMQV
jgi:hypothetical protein